MRQIRFLLLLLVLSPALFGQPSAGTDILVDSVDSLFRTMHRDSGLSGAILLARNGTIIYQNALGYAHPQSKAPLYLNNAFNLASVSKQFTAMCAMILKERDKLRYDEDVRTYLSDFPYEGITVRNLLTHTSGLVEYFDLYEKYFPQDRIFTNRDMLDLFIERRPPLAFTPGEQFQYSNTGYLMLALVIEAASRQTLPDFITKNIVEPLQLAHTYPYNLTMPGYPADRVFGFHTMTDSLAMDDLYNIDGVAGDGNMYASAPDLQRWSQALYQNKLVSAETMAEAYQPFTLNDGSKSYYGFGWGLREDGSAVSHTGGWVGFLTYIRRDLTGPYEFILLTNSGFGPIGRMIRRINGLLDGGR